MYVYVYKWNWNGDFRQVYTRPTLKTCSVADTEHIIAYFANVVRCRQIICSKNRSTSHILHSKSQEENRRN